MGMSFDELLKWQGKNDIGHTLWKDDDGRWLTVDNMTSYQPSELEHTSPPAASAASAASAAAGVDAAAQISDRMRRFHGRKGSPGGKNAAIAFMGTQGQKPSATAAAGTGAAGTGAAAAPAPAAGIGEGGESTRPPPSPPPTTPPPSP